MAADAQKFMIRIVSTLVLLLATAAGVQAAKPADFSAELQPAQQVLASGDYKRAYMLYARRAAHNPLAQFMLGLFYKNGWDRPVDEAVGCRWFEKSAQRKIPAAQHYLGDCLTQGAHRRADPTAALALYLDAAAGGHLISLCSAADLYIKGIGVGKDAKRGLELCTQVAQAGSPPAMIKMANYYREGADVAQDLAAARSWYQQAAERHSPEGQYRLGVMLSEGLGGDPDLNAALYWLETAASEGYAPAYLPTAILYANAEVDPASGVLKPEHLAKIYLWNSVAKISTVDPVQIETIARIDAMLQAVMPAAWRPRLDQQIADHLAKFKP